MIVFSISDGQIEMIMTAGEPIFFTLSIDVKILNESRLIASFWSII